MTVAGNGHVKPRILLVARPEAAAQLQTDLSEHPRGPEIANCTDSETAVATAQEFRPDVVLVDVAVKPGGGYDVVRHLMSASAGLSALLLAADPSREDFRRALQVGARDMLQAPPARDDLFRAVDAALEVSLGKRSALETFLTEDAGPRRARVIAVFSTKGGTGKTFVATNLAAGLAQAGNSVALLDLDLQFGDAALALGLTPQRTIYDLVQTYTELDAELLREFMLAHSSGLQLLPAPLFPDQAEEITVRDVRRVLEVVTLAYDVVVIDSPPFFEERILIALDAADTVVHIASMDLPSVKNLKVTLTMLDAMGQPRSKLRLVMNRADSSVGLTVGDAEKHLGVKIDHALPSSVEVPRALNAGETILVAKPGARVSRELAQLVSSFDPSANGRAPGRGFRLLRRARTAAN